MTSGAQTSTPALRRPTFDWPAWRPSPVRIVAAVVVLAFAVDLLFRRRSGDVALGVVLVAETILLSLPWRLPRRARSAASFCAETAVGLITPVGAAVIVAVTRPAWLDTAGRPVWYVAAIAVAALLAVTDGVNLRAAASGELSFFAGPTPTWFRRARATSIAVGAVGEEAAFRGPVLLATSDVTFAVLAALAFVARHHVQPGTNGRGTGRSWAVEIVGAGGFLALTLLSGSLYPALAAHVLYNLPGFTVEMRRESEPSG
jgi:hypothetical protein